MRWSDLIDENEIRKAIAVLQDPKSAFEVRAIGTAKKDILSGYFQTADDLLKAFGNIDLRQRNVYITLGRLDKAVLSRAQSGHFLKSPQTTSDNEVRAYRWLFIDLDPVRMAGISSTDEELAAAKDLSVSVREYLSGLGFEDPVVAMSGNGYHLLYRIDVRNDEYGRQLVEKCLKVLASIFDNDAVKVDTSNYNPSRICKLHGTMAQKGSSTEDRPYRMSRLLEVPEPVTVTKRETLKALAAELPDDLPAKKPSKTMQAEFDLVDFMREHGMTYEEDHNDRATIYKLDECPFDPSHKDGDAKIFQYHNGAIAFKCHHNSCRSYKWQDVRDKFDPGVYENHFAENDSRYDEGYKQHVQKVLAEAEPVPKKKWRKLKTAEDLMQKDLPEPKVFIGVGAELPILVEGTCILSAKPKLGKSWLSLAMCLAVSNGSDFLGYKTQKCSTLYLDLETSEVLQQKRLRKALKGAPVPQNFYLETEADPIGNGFCEQLEKYLAEDPNIGIVVVDVFQIIRSPAKSFKETEYEHAYRDITPLNELAQKYHIAIILVCHDRKAVDPDDPFSNILGSTGLQGAATQMMVMFKKKKSDPIHLSIKGKTIDGLPELNVKLNQAEWSVVEGVDPGKEDMDLLEQYRESPIREGIVAIMDHNSMWKGRCSSLINEMIQYDVAITCGPKEVGGFIHRHQGRFLKEDSIKIKIIDNGTGAKTYQFEKLPLMTVDEPLIGFEKVSNYAACEIPFS